MTVFTSKLYNLHRHDTLSPWGWIKGLQASSPDVSDAGKWLFTCVHRDGYNSV